MGDCSLLSILIFEHSHLSLPGGGVGLSIYGKYRVATEHTVFAMPETAIGTFFRIIIPQTSRAPSQLYQCRSITGLFPDVGSMYWMPRKLPFSTAMYIALSGARLKAFDLMDTGLATHYIPSAKINDLEAALVEATDSGGDAEIQTVLDSLTEVPEGKSSLNHGLIDEALSQPEPLSMEDLMERLETSSDPDFGAHTIATLNKMSPMSLKVTMEGLKRGRACADIAEDLAMEYRMAQGCMRTGSDFYEGIRAVLVDKDYSPKWDPSRLTDIDQTKANAYFDRIQEEWAVPENFRSSRKPLSKL
jgi:enoyl-CoA hydratase/carnithine racemase